MKATLCKLVVTLHLGAFLVLWAAGCGGSSNSSGGSTGGGPGGGTPGPSAGAYLWEFSLTDNDLFYTTVNSSTGQLGSPTLSQGLACNSLGTIPLIAIAPSNKFAFVIDDCLSSIHVYAMNAPGLSLGEIPQSPYFFPSALNSIAFDPSGKFIYVIGSPGIIYQIPVNGSTGELSTPSTMMEAADFREVVVDPGGKFIFANDLTGGRIFAFLIGVGGSLSPVPGSPFTAPANGQPVNIVMESSGKFLYAPLFSGGIAGFAVNSSTGILSDIPGSPFPTITPPFAVAADPLGRFFYSIGGNLNSSIEAFSLDASTGALTAITGSPFSTPASLDSLVVDPSGHFLYASVQATTLPDSKILGFAIDASGGSLTALATSPYPAPPFPVNLVSLNIP